MNVNQEKILLPNDVRKLLNIDNKEIVELCKKTSINPKKDSKGQIYFSVDEVKRLKNAKSSIVSEMNEKKSALSVVSKPNSQMVVNNLLDTLNKMENNITESMTKIIDEKLVITSNLLKTLSFIKDNYHFDMLKSITAVDLKEPWNKQGWGMLNISRALE